MTQHQPMNRRNFLVTALGALAATACVGTSDTPIEGTQKPSTSAVPDSGADPTSSTAPSAPSVAPAVDPLEPPPGPLIESDPFTLGVASGDPLAGSVILWTRLMVPPEIQENIVVVWEVATDSTFDRLVRTDLARARADDAYAIHVDADGLEPDSAYHYRFRAGDHVSAIGRTRTAPETGAGTSGSLRVASLSCQNWQHGFFHAHDAVADADVDLIVFCGDYIYESASPEPVRSHATPEPTDLAGYRARYAEYRADAPLQRAHAAAPWIITWDDHEVQNNYAGMVPAVSDPDFEQRRQAAHRAWWEHMPVRIDRPEGAEIRVHRAIEWGDLARFIVLDGRQFRDDQPCGDGFGDRCEEALAPGRTMLGAEQEAWLEEQLAASFDGWTVLVQQTVMTDLNVRLTGTPITNFDQWDGYAAARSRLFDAIERHQVSDLVVLSGDIHSSIVAGLVDIDRDRAVASERRMLGTEFVTPSATSRFAADRAALFTLGVLTIPHVEWVDADRHGHLELTIDDSAARADYLLLDTVATAEVPTRSNGSSWSVARGTPGPQPI